MSTNIDDTERTFYTIKAKHLYDFNQKYNWSHLDSALSFLPSVEYIYSEIDKCPNLKVFLGKPFGAGALYHEWFKRGHLQEHHLKPLLGVYRRSDQELLKIPSIEYISATLGNALGVAIGQAYADKDSNFLVSLSDGACHMGITLEAILLMHRLKIKNIKVVIDWNNYTSMSQGYNSSSFKNFIDGLGLHEYFTFLENPKGLNVKEQEDLYKGTR